MVQTELRRAVESQPWARDVNVFGDVLLGNNAGRVRLLGDDGVRRHHQTGASIASGNHALAVGSSAGLQAAFFHSATAPTNTTVPTAANAVLLIEDAGISLGRGTELRLYNAAGTNYVNWDHSETNDVGLSADTWVANAFSAGVLPAVSTVAGTLGAQANILWKSGTAFVMTFDHAITADRTQTFQDLAGNVCLLGVANLTAAGHLLFTDNTVDVGQSKATRPRNGYFAGDLVWGSATAFELSFQHAITADRVVSFQDLAGYVCLLGVANNAGVGGDLIFLDNTYDIGRAKATRPRSLYLSGDLFWASATAFEMNFQHAITADRVVSFQDLAGYVCLLGVANNAGAGGDLLFLDATYDIGKSGATRPRDLFLSRDAVVGGTITATGAISTEGNLAWKSGTAFTMTLDHAITADRTVTFQNLAGAVALLGVANETASGGLLFTDNTVDIGASGATRPRSIYVATSVFIGTSPATAGAIALANNTTVFARNFLNNGNLTVIGTDGSDNTLLGAASALSINSAGSAATFNAAVTFNAATMTFAVDTNVVLSGGVGGLSFDTSTLSIDSTNDRVGIGTATPGVQLHVYHASAPTVYIGPDSSAGTVTALLNLRSGSTGGDATVLFSKDLTAHKYYLAYYDAGNVLQIGRGGTVNTTPSLAIDSSGNTRLYGALRVDGNVTPDGNKTRDLGATGSRWNNIYYVSATTGTSRLVESSVRCPKDDVPMLRGTGTTYVLGEDGDYAQVFCSTCGDMRTEKLRHLPPSKLVERRPAPKIVCRGLTVQQLSGNTRNVRVEFDYGDGMINSTILGEAEYAAFRTMAAPARAAFLRALGQREWDALEEVRLMGAVVAETQALVDALGAGLVGRDLLKIRGN